MSVAVAAAAAVIGFVLLSEVARALPDVNYEDMEQHPIDPDSQQPVTFRPGSVAAGGHCRSSLQCKPGWCCLRHFKHGSYTCQRKLQIGRRCSHNSEVKGGVYHKQCPCADRLRCRGDRGLKLCLPKNWWPSF
ncbi:uncharacterized protein LOC144107362 [Amblyomma americanum]